MNESRYRSRSSRPPAVTLGAALVLLEGLYCCLWFVGPAPLLVKLAVAAVNVAAFMMYMLDKQYAVAGKWRIPEKWLFAVTLFGGVMGADFARRLYRHKTKKRAFSLCVAIALVIQVFVISAALQFWGAPAQAQPVQAQTAATSKHHMGHAYRHKLHTASNAPAESE
jgi:uncharacterized membrane protein YsdA (DUF1294 family)